MSNTRILSVGEDLMLLETRNTILGAAGYIVESARSLKQAIDQFLAGYFDVVILCYSIASKDRDRLTCWIRASGSLTPVVSISDNPVQCDNFADAPKNLLSGIRDILNQAARISSETASLDGSADARSSKGNTRRRAILCIDDEPNLLVLRRRLLESAGYLVLTANCGSEGLKLFSTGIVDAVVLDYAMPMMNGGAVAAQMRQIKEDVPLILLSGASNIPAEELGLFSRFITKGGPPNMLLSTIEGILYAPDEQKITAQPAKSCRTYLASLVVFSQ